LGLEAAHIKWFQAGGPDIEANGLAMCSLHHKLFDLGVFTIAVKEFVWAVLSAPESTQRKKDEEWLVDGALSVALPKPQLVKRR
jgi:putative restriction endonuclease